MALVRGPSASEDTASSSENKVSCKSGEDPTHRNHLQDHLKEMNVLTVIKPQNRAFRKPQNRAFRKISPPPGVHAECYGFRKISVE